MEIFLIVIVWLLNFGISWLNAWSVGRSWADSKATGSWPRVVTWSAAVMSACGFTWCYLILLVIGADTLGVFAPDPKTAELSPTAQNPHEFVKLALEMGYVVIIFPILGSGLAIWIDSVTTAWRRRDAVSIGVAGWNTFAQAHNTFEAARTLPAVFKDLGSALKGGDVKGKAFLLALILVAVALCAGILTTVAIVRSTARKYAHNVLSSVNT